MHCSSLVIAHSTSTDFTAKPIIFLISSKRSEGYCLFVFSLNICTKLDHLECRPLCCLVSTTSKGNMSLIFFFSFSYSLKSGIRWRKRTWKRHRVFLEGVRLRSYLLVPAGCSWLLEAALSYSLHYVPQTQQ